MLRLNRGVRRLGERRLGGRFLFVLACLAIGGCGLVPPAVSIASFAADALSYAVSGKSVSDHGLSLVMQEDCAVLNFIQGQAICAPGPHPEIEMATPRDPDEDRTLLASAGGRGEAEGPLADAPHWAPPSLDGFLAEYAAAGLLLDAGPIATALPLEPVASGVVVDAVAAAEPARPQASVDDAGQSIAASTSS